MLTVSRPTLKVFAALTWYIGSVVLLIKGGSLLIQAALIKPAQTWPWFAALAGMVIGGVKAKSLFIRVCRKNLERIASLAQPKAWLFYRPWFFVFLACMIFLGGMLSRMAQGHYAFLLGVAILDISVGTALLVSSITFWQK